MSAESFAQTGYTEWSNLYGSDNIERSPMMALNETTGEFYQAFYTEGDGLQVTDGSVSNGSTNTLGITRHDANGNVVCRSYLAAPIPINNGVYEMQVFSGGGVGVIYAVASATFTDDFGNSGTGIYYSTINDQCQIAATIKISDTIPPPINGETDDSFFTIDETGNIYVAEVEFGDVDITITKINPTTGATITTTYGGSADELGAVITYDNGTLYVGANGRSSNMPTTDGSSGTAYSSTVTAGIGPYEGPYYGVLATFDANSLALQSATYLNQGSESMRIDDILIANGNIYTDLTVAPGFDMIFNFAGSSPTYQPYTLPITTGSYPNDPATIDFLGTFGLYMYFPAIAAPPVFNTFSGVYDATTLNNEYLAYVDAEPANPGFSSSIQEYAEDYVVYADGSISLFDAYGIPTGIATLTQTNSYSNLTSGNCIIIEGDRSFTGAVRIVDTTTGFYIEEQLVPDVFVLESDLYFHVGGNHIYFTCIVRHSSSQPVAPLTLATNNEFPLISVFAQGANMFAGKYNLCPDFSVLTNQLTSGDQMVCTGGTGMVIDGSSMELTGDNFPPFIDQDNVPVLQPGVEPSYQWQIADNATGPWENIAGATFEDYLPAEQNVTRYYRRTVTANPCCGITIPDSNVIEVAITPDAAPDVDTGGILFSCVNSPVTLGGSPTVDEAAGTGTGTYTYEWDNLDLLDDATETTANPIATVTQPTVFTLTVTDANNCISIEQVVVNVPELDAPEDVQSCGGEPVLIGNPPLVSEANATYSWALAGGGDAGTTLSCTDCAQPEAAVTTTTDYELTVTLNTGTPEECSFVQTVNVAYIGPPTANSGNFAGDDVVICYGETAQIGAPAEAGWTYTWTPGSGISDDTVAQPTIDFGLTLPDINPRTYYVTATRDGCTFTDEVTVSVIWPFITEETSPVCVYETGVGLSTFGQQDATPNVNETYQWAITNGTATIAGPTDGATVQVSAPNDGTTSTLQLTTTLDGVSCTETIDIQYCDFGCDIDIDVTSDIGCPSTTGGNTVTLSAVDPFGNPLGNSYTYSWTPTTGLSVYDQRVVEVLTADPMIFTVTATDTNSGQTCTQDIEVNNPQWVEPDFDPQEIVSDCSSNFPISIGLPPVTGYSYSWSIEDVAGVFSTGSQPQVQLSDLTGSSTVFNVVVSDDVTGCTTQASVTVNLTEVIANAGPDIVVCGDAVITLGTPALPGYTYSWSPAANYQNGTDGTSAQPEILYALTTNQTFTLTATSPDGCVAMDTMEVIFSGDAEATLGTYNDVTSCASQNTTIGNPEIGGLEYTWSILSGDTASLPSIYINSAQPIVNPDQTTVYQLAANFLGDCSDPIFRTVTVTTQTVDFTLVDQNYCPADGPVTIGSAAPIGGYTYSWSGPEVSGTTSRTVNVQPTVATTYSLTVTDTSNGCSGTQQITVTPDTAAPIVTQTSITACVGEEITLGSSSNPSHSPPTTIISWTSNPATPVSGSTSTTPAFTPTVAGIYEFTFSITQNGCENTTMVIVEAVDLPIVPDMDPVTVCLGEATFIGVPPETGLVYSWFPQTNLESPYSSQTAVTTVTQTIEYTLTATDPTTGCSTSKSVTVAPSSNEPPTVGLSSQSLCIGDTTTLTPNITPSDTGNDYIYQWELVSSTNTILLTDALSANASITAVDEGTETVRLTVTNMVSGCSTVSETTIASAICTPAIDLGKSAATPINNGDGTWTVVYTVTATNTGSASGTYDVIEDFMPGTGITLNTATVAYGGEMDGTNGTITNMLTGDSTAVSGESLSAGATETWVITATFAVDVTLITVTGSDCANDAGENGETGFANSITGSTTDTDMTNNNACVALVLPELTLEKSITNTNDLDGNGIGAGDEITYIFEVTNTGNVTIGSLTIDDAVLGTSNLPVVPGTLTPGETGVVTMVYTISQEDMDNGGIENTATVRGEGPGGDPGDPSDDITDVSDTGTDSSGNVITNPDTSETVNPLNINPNELLDPTDDPTTLLLNRISGMELLKSVTTVGNAVGDVVVYDIVVTNTGNVTLSNIEVSDPTATIAQGNPIASLAPGTSTTVTATYTITQADVDAGGIENTATGTGDSPTGIDDVTDVSDTGTDDSGTLVSGPGSNETDDLDEVNSNNNDGDPTNDVTPLSIVQTPSISLMKSGVVSDVDGDGVLGSVGDGVDYSFTVENTGNVTLTDITIDDPLPGIVVTGGPIASLAPGEVDTRTFTATYTITQADVDAGVIINQATVFGEIPGGDPDDPTDDVTDTSDDPADPTDMDGDPDDVSDNDGEPDDPTLIALTAMPALSITKIASESEPQPVFGGSPDQDIYRVTYTIIVENTGDVPLNDLELFDDLAAVFPSPMEFTLVSPPLPATGTLGSVIQTDPVYDGQVRTNILAEGNTLLAGESFSITLGVEVDVQCTFVSVQNRAQAFGTDLFGTVVSADSSSDPGNATVSFVQPSFFVPDGFSPNNDGLHDTFVVEKASCIDVSAQFYNRWGNLVWTTKGAPYQNNWDGTSNTGIHVGDDLPDGTYYSILTTIDSDGNNRRIVGYLTLRR